MVDHWHVTYNDIHNLIRQATPKIAAEFNPDLLIAIGEYPSNLNHPLIKPFFLQVEVQSLPDLIIFYNVECQ